MAPAELPEELRQAWGVVAPRRPRGPAPALTLETILATAVELGDSGGLDAVSLTGVARRLGVSPNALYRYLGSREELRVLARERALGVPAARRNTPLPWPDAVLGWALALRERYREHPWLVDVPVRLPSTPHALTWLEAMLEGLLPAPFDTARKLRLAGLVDGYVRSSARTDRDIAAQPAPVHPDDAVVAAVAALLGDYDLPLVAEVFAAGHWRESAAGDEFRLGLRYLLAGFTAETSELFTGVLPTPAPAVLTSHDGHPADPESGSSATD